MDELTRQIVLMRMQDPQLQELLFNSYLNDVFGGALTGNVSHILGIPGSTRANVQYQKRF